MSEQEQALPPDRGNNVSRVADRGSLPWAGLALESLAPSALSC